MTARLILCASVLIGMASPAHARHRTAPEPFKELSMIFETNQTDEDAEVVIFLKAEEGLRHLVVRNPRGRKIINLRSRDQARGIDPIGLAQMRLETGEPSIEGVLMAYPQGVYRFSAVTVSGARLYGEVVLSHDILDAPTFQPAGQEGLDPDDTVVTWEPIDAAAEFIVEVEQDDLEVNVTARLNGDTTSFRIPAGFLVGGTTYQVSVAVVNDLGNVVVVEDEFTTQ